MYTKMKKVVVSVVAGIVCVVMLNVGTTKDADAQEVADYALLAGYISLVALINTTELGRNVCPAYQGMSNAVEAIPGHAEDAEMANADGDDSGEVAGTSAAMGAADAYMATSQSCEGDSADEARTAMQAASEVLLDLRSQAIARLSQNSCGNEVVDSGELCDYTADPLTWNCPPDTLICTINCECQGGIIVE